YRLAYQAGLKALLDELSARRNAPVREEIQPPPQEAVTQDIAGVEVMELEEAVRSLWKKGIYAQSGMGCTGPVVMVSEQNLSRALAALREGGFVSG
ncbi:MAG TPA: glycine reductase, partial [Clostridia bacterium]|nr:glycine reductase [Clostridia bacterium]